MKQVVVRLIVAVCVIVAALGPASAATVAVGLLGSYSATTWPILVAQKKGFFSEQSITPDIIFAPSAPSLTQQLIGGSLDVIGASGVAEPLLAADRKAPVAILRVVGATPNLDLLVKPGITSIEQLKGHRISVAQLSGMTRIMFDAMIVPHGLTIDDFTVTEADSSAQRLAALASGAVDATMLATPLNFLAEQQGFKRLAAFRDSSPDMPQTCAAVNTRWAAAHPDLVTGLVAAIDKAIDWLYDPVNRDEAVRLIVATTKENPEIVGKSLDYLLSIGFFAKTDTISRSVFEDYISKLRALKLVKTDLKLEQAVYPTVRIVN
jgi:NitT/TauT family transport system substrate-binding protein